MLRGLRGERTVILCTHDLEEAQSLASQVAVLSEGRLAAVGPSDEVLGRADALDLFRRGAGAPA
jgi:ABC-2 type transport system ATP-binding protein